MTDPTSILIFIIGTILFTIFAIFLTLYIAIQKKKQYQHKIEKQDMEHRFSSELMQSRLEVQEETLKQFSEELHDNIAQLLGIIKMNLHEAERNSDGTTKEMLTTSLDMLGDAIADVRTMSHTMNGAFVLRKGLTESIQKDLQHIQAARRINCTFTTTGEEYTLGEDKELLTFRIVQEAVANAVKHGQPDKIVLQIAYEPDKLIVTVTDNGRGFDVEHKEEEMSGLGLMNMKERIKLLKGTVNISSSINKGTEIQLIIPSTDAHKHNN